jgi:DNA primase
MSTNELYDRVKLNVDIIKMIQKYMTLEKEGNFWIGMCPFCKAPELFLASENSHAFFCFSCFSTGDVMDFISKIGGMKKSTAARFLYTLNKKDEGNDANKENIEE